MRAQPLACQELVEIVTAYFEGTLSRRDRRRFDAHLRACDGCSAYVEQMRVTIRLTGTLREEDIEPAAREALLHAFRDWRAGAAEPA
jgi:anti-sigma factor RsiW